jgi:glutathione S-transferase
MKLYGSTTSPFVRRVRVVATEVGEPIDWVQLRPDDATLHALSPIRKVPVAVVDGKTLMDSRTIIDWMIAKHGWHGLRQARDRWHDANLMSAIDAAVESMVQLFVLRRDGVAIDDTPYAARQLARTDAIFAWLASQPLDDGFGLPQISLVCALDWMDFRDAYPTARAAGVEPVRAAWRDRPSLASTRPYG